MKQMVLELSSHARVEQLDTLQERVRRELLSLLATAILVVFRGGGEEDDSTDPESQDR